MLREFRKRFRWKRLALFKLGQWHFHQDNTPVYNSILVTDYLTKMGIKTVPHPPYSPDLAPCDFCLFPKPRGRRYETIEEMREAVTKVIDMLTEEYFLGIFHKLLERYNKCTGVKLTVPSSLLKRLIFSSQPSNMIMRYNNVLLNNPLELLGCNGYRCRKWTRQHEFKSWTRLIAVHIALIPLGKV